AAPAQAGRQLAAVLVRCDGDGGLAEPAAAALAHEAVRNGVAVVAIGLRARPGAQSAGLAPLPTQRTRLFLHPVAP
ncbi:MAG: hypothetical protein L6R48_19680, partial [Planctomycetes bacterium]|nr:hypothetical protein [Planctomycetota bacterium]